MDVSRFADNNLGPPLRMLFGGFLNSYGFYSILLLGFLTFTKIG